MENEGLQARQYLTFTLDREVFAIQIFKVREVVELSRITKVPQAEDYMIGVINLRGNVVPVVDMRIKFGLAKSEYTRDTSIIIAEASKAEGDIVVGALVDSVKEVIDLDEKQLEPPPGIGMRLERKFVTAIGRRDDGFIIILDIDKVFSSAELEAVAGSVPEHVEA
jgi:purine-binding chemotaxis protein CheW